MAITNLSITIDTTRLTRAIANARGNIVEEVEKAIADATIVALRPVCPCCNQEMVRTHYQNEEDDWFVCWLCGCEPDPELVKG